MYTGPGGSNNYGLSDIMQISTILILIGLNFFRANLKLHILLHKAMFK